MSGTRSNRLGGYMLGTEDILSTKCLTLAVVLVSITSPYIMPLCIHTDYPRI